MLLDFEFDNVNKSPVRNIEIDTAMFLDYMHACVGDKYLNVQISDICHM